MQSIALAGGETIKEGHYDDIMMAVELPSILLIILVDPTRLGLVTSSLQMKRSTIELRAHQNYRGSTILSRNKIGTNPAFYQLNYRPYSVFGASDD